MYIFPLCTGTSGDWITEGVASLQKARSSFTLSQVGQTLGKLKIIICQCLYVYCQLFCVLKFFYQPMVDGSKQKHYCTKHQVCYDGELHIVRHPVGKESLN